jgi:hypothetical protein
LWAQDRRTGQSSAEAGPEWYVHFCLDAKTNQKDQGCAEIGYLRFISAEIFQTRSHARSDREDLFTLRFRSGRDADFSEAGGSNRDRASLGAPVHVATG